jgi:hypothetical protein
MLPLDEMMRALNSFNNPSMGLPGLICGSFFKQLLQVDRSAFIHKEDIAVFQLRLFAGGICHERCPLFSELNHRFLRFGYGLF